MCRRISISILYFCTLLSFMKCGSTQQLTSVRQQRTSQIVAEDLLKGKWLHEFNKKRPDIIPTIIFGKITDQNRYTNQEILLLNKEIAQILVNSGKVRLVQDAKKRTEIREERSNQRYFSDEAQHKALAEELGADFILQGIIYKNEVYASSNREFSLELVNIKNNEIVWIKTDKALQDFEAKKKKRRKIWSGIGTTVLVVAAITALVFLSRYTQKRGDD